MSMRLCATAAAALATTLVCATARAQKSEPRRGVYASGALGFGVGMTREFVAGEPATHAGMGLEVHAALGYAPVDGLAFAADGRLLLQGDVGARALGGLVDWYPAPRGPWHVELGLGHVSEILIRSFGSATDDSGSRGGTSSSTGVLGHAAVGYAFRPGGRVAFSPVLDAYRIREASYDAYYDTYGVMLELTVVRL